MDLVAVGIAKIAPVETIAVAKAISGRTLVSFSFLKSLTIGDIDCVIVRSNEGNHDAITSCLRLSVE